MVNLLKNNSFFIIIIFFASLIFGILIEILSKDLTKTEIYSAKVNFSFDPSLTVYTSTFDLYDYEIQTLLTYNRVQSASQTADIKQNSSILISQDTLTNIFYENYSKKELFINFSEFFYLDNQIISGNFSLISRNKNLENEIKKIISNLNNKIKNLYLTNFNLRKELFLKKEEEAENYLIKEINRLQNEYLFLSDKNNINLNKKQIIETAYKEKKDRIEKALKYSLSNKFKTPLLTQINPNIDFLYLLGSDVLQSMLDELVESKDFYMSNPQFLYNNFLPNYSTLIELLNSLRNDVILNDFLYFYEEFFDYVKDSNSLVNFEIVERTSSVSDLFLNLRYAGTITIIFTTLGLLFGISYLILIKKD